MIKKECLIDGSMYTDNLLDKLSTEAKSACIACVSTYLKSHQEGFLDALRGKKLKVTVSLEVE
jgi:hypothetical protein